jgi:hypothetical protein
MTYNQEPSGIAAKLAILAGILLVVMNIAGCQNGAE